MLKYWVWLAELPGVQNQARLALLRHFGSPEDIFFADREELLLAEDVPPAQAERALNRDLSAANRILADCQRLGQRILTIQDAEYPQRLRNIYDPPVLLYVRGRLPAFDEEAAVAVVGTRECTPYGRACAERLGWGLASGGALVVTGLAKGVDASAARGALRAGGTVVGVTGNGLDVYYPYENRELYDDVAAAGALLSEYPPGPEAVDAPDSVGCHRLIRAGAGLAAEAGDILRDYKARFPDKLRIREAAWTPAPGRRRTPPLSEPAAPEPEDAGPEKPEAPPPVSPSGLTDDQIALLRILDPEKPAQVDDLIADTGVPARRVSSALTMLEIDGMVCQHSGKRYTRTVTLAE